MRLISILLLSIFLGCFDKSEVLPYYKTPDFMPHFISNKEEALEEINHTVADFEAFDQNNLLITHGHIEGKVHVANFMFTRCTSICPIMTNHLKIIEKAYFNHKEVSILSFSVTPWSDSIAVLKSFANSYGIKSKNWHFLSGKTEEIYELARKSYFAEKELGFTKDSTDFLHTEHVLLVDKTKRIRGIYNATLKLDMKQLKEDISNLLDK